MYTYIYIFIYMYTYAYTCKDKPVNCCIFLPMIFMSLCVCMRVCV